MCYTSGTTGMPKGVLASHRAIVLHSMASGMVDTLGLGEHDTVHGRGADVPRQRLGPAVHLPAGRREASFPGPHLDPPSLLELLVNERVTITAGVPTIWLGMLQILDDESREVRSVGLARDRRPAARPRRRA